MSANSKLHSKTAFGLTFDAPFVTINLSDLNGSVAQLDRALDFESIGRGFESLRGHHKLQAFAGMRGLFLCQPSDTCFKNVKRMLLIVHEYIIRAGIKLTSKLYNFYIVLIQSGP